MAIPNTAHLTPEVVNSLHWFVTVDINKGMYRAEVPSGDFIIDGCTKDFLLFYLSFDPDSYYDVNLIPQPGEYDYEAHAIRYNDTHTEVVEDIIISTGVMHFAFPIGDVTKTEYENTIEYGQYIDPNY